MPINFPTNPNSGDTYAYNDVTWSWNSYAWDKISGVSGSAGVVGNYVSSFGGKTGPVGAGVTSSQILYWANNDVTGSNNFTFDGTDVVTLATTGHYTGRLLGPVLVPIKNTSGVSIPKGTPVYATGSVGASGQVEVAACDASNSAKMPAIGLADSTLAINDIGHAVVFGNLEQVDTSSYTINGTVYIASGGGLTGIKPTGANDLIQNIGRVIRVQASTGDILVSAIGRSNDVPNILQARSWLQMPDGMTATGLVKSFNGLTGAVTGVGSFNGSTGTVVFSNYVSSFNGLTGAVTGVTTSAANTFTALQTFNAGITSAGATFNGAVTFNENISLALGKVFTVYNINQGSANSLYIGDSAYTQTFIGDYSGNGNNTYIHVNDDIGDIYTFGPMHNNNSIIVDDGLNTATGIYSGSIQFIGARTQTWLPTIGATNTTITFPFATTTLAGLSLAQTFTALQTFNAGLSGALTGNATSASTVSVTDTNSSTTWYPVFVGGTGSTGTYIDKTTTPLTYVPSTGTLTSTSMFSTSAGVSSTLSVATIQEYTGGNGVNVSSQARFPSGISAAGGTFSGTQTFINGATFQGNIVAPNIVTSFNGLTGAVTGVTTGTANTFGPLQTFTNGISASGATFTGQVTVTNFKANTVSGDEGGQIDFGLAATNTSLTGGVAIDIYQNKLRLFETGGTNRGAYIDLTGAGAGVGSDLLTRTTTAPPGYTSAINTFNDSTDNGSKTIYYLSQMYKAYANYGAYTVKANRTYFTLFSTNKPVTIKTIRSVTNATVTTGNCYLSVYSADTTTGLPKTMLYCSASLSVGSNYTGASVTNASGLVTVPAGHFYLAATYSSTPIVFGYYRYTIDGVFGASSYSGGPFNMMPIADYTGFTAGSLPASGVTLSFIENSAGNYLGPVLDFIVV